MFASSASEVNKLSKQGCLCPAQLDSQCVLRQVNCGEPHDLTVNGFSAPFGRLFLFTLSSQKLQDKSACQYRQLFVVHLVVPRNILCKHIELSGAMGMVGSDQALTLLVGLVLGVTGR